MFAGKPEAPILSMDCTHDRGAPLAINKDTLKKMRIIGQVDTKFILVKEANVLYVRSHLKICVLPCSLVSLQLHLGSARS